MSSSTPVNNDSRVIYLGSDIDHETATQVCFNIAVFNSKDDNEDKKLKDYERKPIRLFINTKGGDVYAMWAMVDIIERSKTPVYTYCSGCAMSAGFIVYLAGHKRFASEHVNFMYHQIWMTRSGKYQDIVEDRDQTDYLQDELEKYVLSRTNISEERISEIRDKKVDTFIHFDEAVKLGIVTEKWE